MLKKTKGVKNIQEHLTRDADLTFEFNSKKYAIEVETGNLIYKKEQLKEKLQYLNRKYSKKRWVFVVSNRDLLKKYKKYGLSTTRRGVLKTLQEMLRN